MVGAAAGRPRRSLVALPATEKAFQRFPQAIVGLRCQCFIAADVGIHTHRNERFANGKRLSQEEGLVAVEGTNCMPMTADLAIAHSDKQLCSQNKGLMMAVGGAIAWQLMFVAFYLPLGQGAQMVSGSVRIMNHGSHALLQNVCKM
jgi:hypothetical protein